ncbi:hypothetical protein [Clostridium tarantellae]|nr:hypothetical protein [Clostridium tarantellae]
MINVLYEKNFINKVINKTIENIFENPNISYYTAIQNAISYYEKKIINL